MKINVITPWYPDDTSIYLGVFVAQQVAALRNRGHEVVVEVPQIYPAPAGQVPAEVRETMQRLAEREPEAVYRRSGGTTWIPSPVPSRSGYSGRSSAFAAAISAKRSVLPVVADVTHAHLGVPTAAAVLDNCSTPLVVTEHQSTLDRVLSETASRLMYIDVIKRSAAFYVVSQHLSNRLADEFGADVAKKVRVMPNIVDLSNLPFLARSEFTCSSWIYVGSLAAHKGAQLLIKSFVEYRKRYDPTASLMAVGGGPLSDWAMRYSAAHGVADGLQLIGPVSHTHLSDYLAEADVMVHLSPAETFGIAALEAIGSGIPVVALQNGGAEDNWGAIAPICGSILDPNSSAEDVAASVNRLRHDSARLDLAEARRFVEHSFSAETIGNRLETIYREVIER